MPISYLRPLKPLSKGDLLGHVKHFVVLQLKQKKTKKTFFVLRQVMMKFPNK